MRHGRRGNQDYEHGPSTHGRHPGAARGGGTTELVLTHLRLPPDKLESHRMGWTDIVGKLGETLDLGETQW